MAAFPENAKLTRAVLARQYAGDMTGSREQREAASLAQSLRSDRVREQFGGRTRWNRRSPAAHVVRQQMTSRGRVAQAYAEAVARQRDRIIGRALTGGPPGKQIDVLMLP